MYVCDEAGAPVGRSSHVALDLSECELTGRVNVASVTAAEYVETRFRVTQIRELACAEEGLDPVTGLVFDECKSMDEPALRGWSHGRGGAEGHELGYACFDPRHGEGTGAPGAASTRSRSRRSLTSSCPSTLTSTRGGSWSGDSPTGAS